MFGSSEWNALLCPDDGRREAVVYGWTLKNGNYEKQRQ